MSDTPSVPQMKDEVQALSVFFQVVFQSASQLSGMPDPLAPEYIALKSLMKHNWSEFEAIYKRLESDIG